MRHLVLASCFLGLLAVGSWAAAETMPAATPTPGEPDLDAVRAAAERFRDIEVALAEGYVRDPMDICEVAALMGQPAELGAMGIHYFRPDLLGITATAPRVDGNGTHIDFLQPSILIYEPQADGGLELVAVENLVFQESWHAAGHDGPPAFHGVPYETMIDDPETEIDEAHMFEAHYDRHVWVFRDNPSGVFAQFNPAVSCEHHGKQASHAMEATSGEATDR
ncbi:MAG TPA: hypothetical protein VMT16_08350 [Thermoanaerobaculia bacterium]|nr:hypothetical protein [Thermoanaerobaculia bacterium]